MFLCKPSQLSSDLSKVINPQSPPGCLTTVLCPTANSWPLFPHTALDTELCFLPLISPDQDFWFPIRRRRSYCGGLTCQARLAVNSDHDWSAAGWEDSRLGSAAESHWRLRDCSSGRFKVDRENYFQGRKMKLPCYQYISFSICTYISNFILF